MSRVKDDLHRGLDYLEQADVVTEEQIRHFKIWGHFDTDVCAPKEKLNFGTSGTDGDSGYGRWRGWFDGAF